MGLGGAFHLRNLWMIGEQRDRARSESGSWLRRLDVTSTAAVLVLDCREQRRDGNQSSPANLFGQEAFEHYKSVNCSPAETRGVASFIDRATDAVAERNARHLRLFLCHRRGRLRRFQRMMAGQVNPIKYSICARYFFFGVFGQLVEYFR
jgi:hypothetical protein